MLEISDLGLSLFQANEVEDADPQLVEAWLKAADSPEIHSPIGFFITGLRTGKPPQGHSQDRVRAVQIAERWFERVGCLYPSEEMALAELFERGGLLRHHAEDEELRARMAACWHKYRPLGEEVEREAAARVKRAREARDARTEAAAESV